MKEAFYRYRNFIKTFTFIAILLCVLGVTLRVLSNKDTGGGGGFERFYNLPKDTVDLMVYGSSHAHCTVDLGYLWENYGIPGYILSAGNQNFADTVSFVEESLRYQHPKVVAVEVYKAIDESTALNDWDIFHSTLVMKYSLNYVKHAFSMKLESDRFDKRFEVVTKFPLVHTRYNELTSEDFCVSQPYFMGYRGSFENYPYEPVELIPDTDIEPLSSDMMDELDRLYEVTRREDVQLILWSAPFIAETEEMRKYNAVKQYAAQRGIPYISYIDLATDIGIDFQTDFRDEDHVNNYGAVKVTDAMAKYLISNYEFADHRNESKYSLWDINARFIDDRSYKHELDARGEINAYLQYLMDTNDEYDVEIVFRGNYAALGDIYGYGMMATGLTQEEYYLGGTYAFHGAERVSHTDDETDCKYHISNKEFEIPENGLLVSVYDSITEYLIDVISIDAYYVGTDTVKMLTE